ncbi:MAG: CHAT domain-containing protein, partial [Symploca sp. SIO3E6]|nr:CHAT domain-containing protein [Caldora sp. SIO3E6]
GNIILFNPQGGITTGNLNSSGLVNGGDIIVQAGNQITTGQINTSGTTGSGGNVSLATPDKIQVNWINTQGGSTGGQVDITAQRFFRAIDSFTANNSLEASISTIGANSSGNITIRHGGNGMTPFDVGNATTNGTAGAITSGEFTITSLQSFLFDHTAGNIQIISTPAPIITDLCPPDCNLDENNSDELVRIPDPGSGDAILNIENVSLGDFSNLVNNREEVFNNAFEEYLELEGILITTLSETQEILSKIEKATGVKPALIYVSFQSTTIPPKTPAAGDKAQPPTTSLRQCNSEQLVSGAESVPVQENDLQKDPLELVLVTSKGIPILRRVEGTTCKQVLKEADNFKIHAKSLKFPDNYLTSAQQFYQWLVAPLEKDLREQGIENLVFIMDTGLRSLPLAALHDGERFIIEKYSIGLMPSMSLTDTNYVDVKNLEVLAMGASEFPNSKLGSLPAVPAELDVLKNLWQGQFFLEEDFTINNLKSQRSQSPFGMLHLATHGEFKGGSLRNSFIQFWGNEKLRLHQVRELGLKEPPVELLVLSACEAIIGNEEAELGFAGFAHLAGVKSVVASLWQVKDLGTLGLMTQFYTELKAAPIKAEALRQAQLAMQRGEVYIRNGKLFAPGYTDGIPLPGELATIEGQDETQDLYLSHPSYWSGFTIVGSPW